MTPQRYRSPDGRFQACLDTNIVRELLVHCRKARGHETGGLLAGTYDDDCRAAIVSRISGPARGSTHGRWSFYRAVGHLQRWLDRLWVRRQGYYLGEWHFHPGGSAEPSSTDKQQMWAIARDEAYACPQPVLVIVGGDPDHEFQTTATVFMQDGNFTRLEPG